MIRAILYFAGFVAITVALIVLQPGAERGAGNQDQPVTRADQGLSGLTGLSGQPPEARVERAAAQRDVDAAIEAALAALAGPRPSPLPPEDVPLSDSTPTETAQAVTGQNGAGDGAAGVGDPTRPEARLRQDPDDSATADVATTAPAGSEALRGLTWDTVARLRAATGRDVAPGQPGSLLHSIVQRSLSEAPEPSRPAAVPRTYTVVSGDSLVSIAEEIYGDVNMTGPLYAANQGLLRSPTDLPEGLELVLPDQ